MKRVLVFSLLLLAFCPLCKADRIDLEQREPGETTEHRPRSINPEVTASIDGSTITLNLNFPSDCEYVVYACSSDTVICSGRFAAGSATAFDLPDSIKSGTYQLCVYAYGCWWTGTFVY